MRRITYLLLLSMSALSLLSACGSDSNDSATASTSIATLPEFEKSAQEVESATARAISEANAIVAKVAALKPGEATFANCVVALDNAYFLVQNTTQRLDLLANVSPDEKVRNQASASVVLLGGWQIDTTSRKDVYAVLRSYADTNPKLAGEDRRLLDDTLRTYERNGLNLPDETRQQITALQKELAAQEALIQQNINAASADVVTVPAQQAQGTPENILAEYERDSQGNYVIPVGITYKNDLFMKFCPDEEARRTVFEARNSMGALANKALMTDAVKKRAKIARLLGYASWADYRTETRMAGTAQHAIDFVQGLIDGLDPKFQAERDALRRLKVSETGVSTARLEAWDVDYFQRILEETRYTLDMESLRKYFRYETVLNGMFRVFEKVFRLKIEYVTPPYVWSPKVQLVRISDAGTGEVLGYLYLDMFPRPDQGKYGHFAAFPITKGKRLASGVYQRPTVALVCNFPEPAPDKPALLAYDDVKTLFHEFGHALHEITTTAGYAAFSGMSVPGDFVEVPSQNLESWITDKRVLDQFAVNYQDPADRIPAEVLSRIDEARKAVIAHFYRRQLAFGKMDLLLHTKIAPETDFDIVAYTNQVLAEVYLPYPEKSSNITAFGHLFGDYDAGYYGYAWADVIVADITSVFRDSPDGFMDAALGLRLRTEVYQPGNSRDVNESVEKFLGRTWNNKAFLKKLGIDG
jgi:thimet oligopeptidase